MQTCAFGAVDVGTGLVAEQEPAVLGADVDAGNGVAALAVSSVVGECERTPEGTGDGECALPEHGVEEGIPRDKAAESR